MEDKDSDDVWIFGYGSLIWKPLSHYGPSRYKIHSIRVPDLQYHVDIPDKRVPGYIRGYVRRFWQASEDHRGTPEAPGRVATLIDVEHWKSLDDYHSHSPDKVWGVAYHIPADKVSEVTSYLGIREVNGYSVQYTQFYAATNAATNKFTTTTSAGLTESSSAKQNPEFIKCLVYVGLPENPQYVGLQDLDSLAAHILRSSGPSGPNKEYLYALEEALNGLIGSGADGVGLDKDRDEHIFELAQRCRQLEEKHEAIENEPGSK